MENFSYKDFLDRQYAQEDTETILRRLHQEHPHSNVITALFLKMLQSDHPKEYDKVKGRLLLSIPHRQYFSGYKISEREISEVRDQRSEIRNVECGIRNEERDSNITSQESQSDDERAESPAETVLRQVNSEAEKCTSGEGINENGNGNIINDDDFVVEKEFDAPTIKLEADQTQVINSLIAKFSNDPPTIKKTPENHNPDANYSEGSLDEDNDIASETLAMIYAKQGHPGKAIKMLQNLCLIFPEKSCYFATLIEGIKSDRNNNQINQIKC